MRGQSLLRCFVGLFTLSIAVAACSAGPNPPGRNDGGARRDSGVPTVADGGQYQNNDPMCGQRLRGCCGTPPSTCQGTLKCEPVTSTTPPGTRCCIRSGGTGCVNNNDCCTGLVCDSANGGVCHVPTGGGCTTAGDCGPAQLCVSGTCQDNPNFGDCGEPGQPCCTGMTCHANGVCNGTTCSPCGGTGQICCDGETKCNEIAEGNLICTATLTCELQTGACGEIGQDCCNGGCAGTAFCNAATMKCEGMPEDCGYENQPCCPDRNICQSELLCDSETRTCKKPPTDCGTLEQMCCDSPTSLGQCVGVLNCQFGECSDCTGPSFTCLLAPDKCCSGTVCKMAPVLPRCCNPHGGACTNNTDCCGLLSCEDGVCQGGGGGDFCIFDSDCATGFECKIPFCRPIEATTTCGSPGTTCQDGATNTCCVGLSCGRNEEDTADACCAAPNSSCVADSDCCGQSDCVSGTCDCRGQSQGCNGAGECCSGLKCVVGECEDAADCVKNVGESCASQDECCGDMQCTRTRSSGSVSDNFCCSPTNFRCESDNDCCGTQTCTDNQCKQRAVGEECINTSDCAGAAFCDTAVDASMGMCSTGA